MFAVIWYYKFIVIWNGTYPVLWDFTYSIFWYFTFIRIPLSDIFDFLLFGFTFLSYKNALQIFFLRFFGILCFLLCHIFYLSRYLVFYLSRYLVFYLSRYLVFYLSRYLVFFLSHTLVFNFYSYPTIKVPPPG